MTTTPTEPTRSVPATLTAAADYLDRFGWTPRGLYDAHSGCRNIKCGLHRSGTYPASVTGAIRVAVYGHARWFLDLSSDITAQAAYTAALEWLNSYLLTYGPARCHASVFDWQSTPGRTRTQVSDALRVAAKGYRLRYARRAA
jgi:hypothetical protein